MERSASRPGYTQWFEDAKFGLFIHWGIYSILGRGEWVMDNEKIPRSEYERLAREFNPTDFDAEEWSTIANAAGVRYVTITSKHHDGFSMFDTRLSEYKITNTPFERDVMSDLSEALSKRGIKLSFYYSQLDWHHGDYFPLGRTGHSAGRQPAGDWSKYMKYYVRQVEELCSKYGKISSIWFDGLWDKPEADWDLDNLYRMIHGLQPGVLVGNNHHMQPFPGEDFQIFEQDLPGENVAGFNLAKTSTLPLETCLTINNSWGYNKLDNNHKSPKELIHYLIKTSGLGANMLLNVGPMPDGRIQSEHVERLRAIGEWLKEHGEAIYGTRKGPYRGIGWTSTKKGNRIYIHVLDRNRKVSLPRPSSTLGSATLMDGTEVKVQPEGDVVDVIIPDNLMDPIDTIIVLEDYRRGGGTE